MFCVGGRLTGFRWSCCGKGGFRTEHEYLKHARNVLFFLSRKELQMKIEKCGDFSFFSWKCLAPLCFTVANNSPLLDYKLSHSLAPWRLRSDVWISVLEFYSGIEKWLIGLSVAISIPAEAVPRPVNAYANLILLICGSPANIASHSEHVWQETSMLKILLATWEIRVFLVKAFPISVSLFLLSSLNRDIYGSLTLLLAFSLNVYLQGVNKS